MERQDSRASCPRPSRRRTPTLARWATAGLALSLAACGRVPGAARWYTGADERVVWHGPDTAKVVALTIDDGPFAASTDSILDVLARHGARATFFLIGSHAEGNQEVVGRLRREGHEVGHHMLLDVPSADLPADTFRAHFAATDSILRSLGARPVWFRPGSGRFTEEMLERLCRSGMTGVLGDVYPFDAAIPSAGFAADFILQRTRPGSILILHDGPRRGARTARVLDHVLPRLRGAGYRVVTLSQLLGSPQHAPRSCATPPVR